ncbi:hypothetical protein VHEMI02176 [[Torrubiella] hemipterigena]|uniref:Uncharacterized protein n=1 Tax=[Torrubiella] hemipterigena TaxID=1531966 RepID=A0A0A1T741_9HYPO|nr:hypothetical protein VHEMI02176 [[Torrubiella] hemipterigena]
MPLLITCKEKIDTLRPVLCLGSDDNGYEKLYWVPIAANLQKASMSITAKHMQLAQIPDVLRQLISSLKRICLGFALITNA